MLGVGLSVVTAGLRLSVDIVERKLFIAELSVLYKTAKLVYMLPIVR